MRRLPLALLRIIAALSLFGAAPAGAQCLWRCYGDLQDRIDQLELGAADRSQRLDDLESAARRREANEALRERDRERAAAEDFMRGRYQPWNRVLGLPDRD